MNRMFKLAAPGMAALLLITAAGCRSASPFSNPFSKQPSEALKSPAEMDELQLKAPPENYTRGEMASKSADSAGSLAQNGDYSSSQVPGFAAAAEPSPAPAAANSPASFPVAQNNMPNSAYQTEPMKTALNPAANTASASSGIPAAGSADPLADIPYAPNSVYPSAAGIGTAGSTSNSGVTNNSGVSSNTGVFAPGSIGGY